MADSKQVASSLKSGLTGGAATGRGVDYQSLYATYLALRLITRLLRETPTERPLLSIEPRILADTESGIQLTRWDIQVSGQQGMATEAKAKATKTDLVEMLVRCRKSARLDQLQKFELVYGECNVGFLNAITKLLRLAEEADSDEPRFQQLCELEEDGDLKAVLDALEDTALPVANRLRLRHLTEDALFDLIAVHLQFLSPPSQRQNLFCALYTRFVRAMQKRTPFFIPTLIRELRDEGFEFSDAGSLLPQDIDPALHSAIYVLQHCANAMPLQVLEDLTGETQLDNRLESLQIAAVNEAELWSVNPLLPQLDHEEPGMVLAKALHSTLAFIRANKSSCRGIEQVANAVAFVQSCATLNPAAATVAFGPLDKILKRSGKKRLVLEVADITIKAARSITPPTRAARKAEAEALICGCAWVYQRIGQFEQAELAASESLKLGQDLGWSRNTAFCLKCIGRLRRVRAEQQSHPSTRRKLLGESQTKLLEAIEAFSKCSEHGPEHPEVGDCHSLLARTLYLMNRTTEAEKHAEQARVLITSEPGYQTSKDYMDLLILEGVLLSDRLNFPAADKKFAEALDCLEPKNAEKSEIAARAHMARGGNKFKWNRDRCAACSEFEHAAKIWHTLGEHFYRGCAEWRVIELNEEVPREVRKRLAKLPEPISVEATRLYRELRQPKSKTTLSQRAELGEASWKKLIKQARENCAIRYERW